MSEPRKSEAAASAAYESWKTYLQDTDTFIANDGRFPDRSLVWTPYNDDIYGDGADYIFGRVPAGYCPHHWGWYQGRVIGQNETNWWFIYLNHQGLPFLVQRHVAELRPVITENTTGDRS
jgi:hypothetical protein